MSARHKSTSDGSTGGEGPHPGGATEPEDSYDDLDVTSRATIIAPDSSEASRPRSGESDGSTLDSYSIDDVEPSDSSRPTIRVEEMSVPVAKESVSFATRSNGQSDPLHPKRSRPGSGVDSLALSGPGDRIETGAGALVLGARLGRGGMAEVCLARRLGPSGFSRKVVVKRLLPPHSHREKSIERFLREARLAAKLRHPNIVEILELGTHNDQYYIVMELIDGKSLWKILDRLEERRRLPPVSAIVRVAADVAGALDYAHNLKDDDGKRRRIIHRDVSPENIMVARFGYVKLLDFGVARDLDVSGLTEADQVIGKPIYLPPEGLGGGDPTSAWDIYSLGVVMYRALAGRPPFVPGEGRGALGRLLDDIAFAEPEPLASLNPAVPVALCEIIAMAMAKDPGDRHARASHLQRDLTDFLRSLPQRGLIDPATMLREAFEEYVDSMDEDVSDRADAGESASALDQDDDEDHEAPPPPWSVPTPVQARRRPPRKKIHVPERTLDEPRGRRMLAWAIGVATLAAAMVGGAMLWWTVGSRDRLVPVKASIREQLTHRVDDPSKDSGTIAIRCKSWGYLYVDGNGVGMCPVTPISVSPGRHKVKLKTRGREEIRIVVVRANRRAVADFTAVAPSGEIILRPR